MLPGVMVPAGVAELLAVFQACFSVPTFRVFSAVVVGALARVERVTVCGMAQASGALQVGHHRFSEFFSRSRWDAHQVGERLAAFVVERLLGAGEEPVLVVDDTLLERWGRKVFGRMLQHDGAAQERQACTWGTCFVVVALVVRLERISPRPIALPVYAALYLPVPGRRGGPSSRSGVLARTAREVAQAQRLLATQQRRRERRRQVEQRAAAQGRRPPGRAPSQADLTKAQAALAHARRDHEAALEQVRAAVAATHHPAQPTDPAPTKTEVALALTTRLGRVLGRRVHVVADAAYHSPALAALDEHEITWTVRARADSVFYAPPPERAPGATGRPPERGPRLGTSTNIAATANVTTPDASGTTPADLPVLRSRTTLPYRTGRLILIRNPNTTTGHDLALFTSDLHTPAHQIAARYTARWAIEVCFREAKQHLGLGQTHNRLQAAVRRTTPLQLLCYSLTICYYALHATPHLDVTRRRHRAPYYTTKTHPSFQDMLVRIRGDLIRARSPRTPPPTFPDHHPHQDKHQNPDLEGILADLGVL